MVAHLKLIEPRNENRSVPVRPANAELRTREYLTAKEVEKLTKATKDGRGRHADRDATLILIAFRHGLAASVDYGLTASATPLPMGPKFLRITWRRKRRKARLN
jgi:hypothetical protein